MWLLNSCPAPTYAVAMSLCQIIGSTQQKDDICCLGDWPVTNWSVGLGQWVVLGLIHAVTASQLVKCQLISMEMPTIWCLWRLYHSGTWCPCVLNVTIQNKNCASNHGAYLESNGFIGLCREEQVLPQPVWRLHPLLVGRHEAMTRPDIISNLWVVNLPAEGVRAWVGLV